MKIRYHKKFEKHFKNLSPFLRNKTIAVIDKFTKNPFEKTLYTHSLSGKLQGKKAFSVTGDIRVIFQEFDNYTLVVMIDVGTHEKVYSNK